MDQSLVVVILDCCAKLHRLKHGAIMQSEAVWEILDRTVPSQGPMWSVDESKKKITVLDKLLYYVIVYSESPKVARGAIRKFKGIDGEEFSGWNEVRVATLGEIRDILTRCGAGPHSWELAITLKDFLYNSWDTLFTLDLEQAPKELKPSEIIVYLEQLEGKTEPSRPEHSFFSRKGLRQKSDAILPASAVSFLKNLWGRNRNAPFEYHTERFLQRIGIIKNKDTTMTKTLAFKQFMGNSDLHNRHFKVLQFSKMICNTDPRCDVCQISDCKSRK